MLGNLLYVLLMSGRTGGVTVQVGRLGLPDCLTCVAKRWFLLEDIERGPRQGFLLTLDLGDSTSVLPRAVLVLLGFGEGGLSLPC